MQFMHPLRRFATYAWALPNTMPGLLIGGLFVVFGARASIIAGAIEFSGGLPGYAVSRLPNQYRFSAITLGHVILGMDTQALSACRQHEHVHIQQYERWGIFFLPAYLLSSLWQLLHGRQAYRDNYFEKQAYESTENCQIRVESRAAQGND